MIEWDESVGTGNVYIDNQHKALFEKYNETSLIFEGDSDGKMSEAAEGLLDFLQFYATWHFKEEEALMDRFHSPAAEVNKIAHAQFLIVFGDFYTQWQDGNMDIDLARETYKSLGLWIRNHVKTIDSQLCVNMNR